MLKRKLTIYSYLAQKKLKHRFKRFAKRHEVQVHKQGNDYDSHIIDDLPLTLSRDPYPGFTLQREVAS